MTSPEHTSAKPLGPVGPVRPPLGRDLIRMTAKIVIGGLVVSMMAAIGVLIVSGMVAASTMGASLDPARESTALVAGEATSRNKVLIVDIRGVILNHPPRRSNTLLPLGPSGVVYGYDIKQKLENAAEDDAVKAVMLHVRTPGGAIAGSQAIGDGVDAVKAAGKPVAVYVDGLSASGGVWATANADGIFADYGSVVGSVGVIGPSLLQYKNPIALGGALSGVETRDGIELHVSSAGRGKDLGNPFRAPTDEEKQKLDAIVDEFYDQFLKRVAKYRGISRDALVNDYGAAVFANDAAERYGYIDGTRTLHETIDWVVGEAKLGDDYRVVAPESGGPSLFGLGVDALSRQDRVTTGTDGDGAPVICDALAGGVVAMTRLHWTSLCGL